MPSSHPHPPPCHWLLRPASAPDPPSAPPLGWLPVRGVPAPGRPAWGVVALPLLARLYVREKSLAGIHPKHRPAFRTKLELALDLMRWAVRWLGFLGKPLWVVADGAYAKAPFLKPMRALGVTVV